MMSECTASVTLAVRHCSLLEWTQRDLQLYLGCTEDVRDVFLFNRNRKASSLRVLYTSCSCRWDRFLKWTQNYFKFYLRHARGMVCLIYRQINILEFFFAFTTAHKFLGNKYHYQFHKYFSFSLSYILRHIYTHIHTNIHTIEYLKSY